MSRTWCWIVAAGVVLAGAGGARAQGTAGVRDELEQIKRLEAEMPEVRGTTWDWGGWYRFSFTRFDDVMQDRELADHDLRLWGTLSIGEVHQFYARGRLTYVDWANGDEVFGDDHDWVGPNLDLGWYRLRLGELARRYISQGWPCDVDLKVGRQFIEVGRGVVLSRILDAATLEIGNPYFETRLFAGKTFASQQSLDLTAPEWWHDERTFLGFNALMKNVIPRYEPYVFVVLVDDHNSYHGVPPVGQQFQYEPRYYGIGSQGSLIPNLRHWTEYVHEGGQSHTRNKDIKANAVIMGAEYFFNRWWTRPRFEIEYAIGSGDSDKGSATNTVGGNLAGTSDRAFLGYGYHDTGVAFAPTLANLRVLRVTGAFRPLEFLNCTRNLELGGSYYWFEKDRSAGGISDFTANVADKDLGTEVDVFANWRITSDLLWTLRWGHFNPGEAFTNRNSREYVLTSITYSF